jgi:hypothetical protein
MNIEDKAMLKFDLLSNGLNISKSGLAELRRKGHRIPSFTRTGASYGIETIINDDIFVNIPISRNSKYYLSDDCTNISIDGEKEFPITILKQPAFYDLTIGNVRLEQYGRMCFDRLGITVNNNCFFKEKKMGCRFCGIESSDHGPLGRLLRPDEINTVVRSAISDVTSGIRHVLLSGGTLPPPDFGATYFSQCVESIKKEFPNLPVYVMLPPPLEKMYMDILLKSGVDEIGMNIELFGDSARKIIPAKSQMIGKKLYLDSLEYLAQRMKKYAVRSILMSSIEDRLDTLQGIEELTKRNVMPIIAVYREVNELSHLMKEGDSQYMFSLWREGDKIARRHNMLLGPLCIPCQNNTLAFPTHADYRFY